MDKQLFDDAIGASPPSTVDVDAVIARGRRADRLRRVANPAVAAGAGVLAVMLGVAFAVLPSHSADPAAGGAVGTGTRSHGDCPRGADVVVGGGFPGATEPAGSAGSSTAATPKEIATTPAAVATQGLAARRTQAARRSRATMPSTSTVDGGTSPMA